MYGESNTVDVTINVNNLPDFPPTINGASGLKVDENSPAETFVGQLSIIGDGSPVISITLSGEGSENFKAYNNGTIVVNEGANLDYERTSNYALFVQAVNAFGSNMVSIRIYVNNINEPPVLQNTHFSIRTRTPVYETIGVMKAILFLSDCDIAEYVTDSSVFGIRDNGEVYTTAPVTEGSNYTVNVYAKSLCGNSNTVSLTIDTENRIISSIGTQDAWDVALSSDETKAFVAEGSLKIIDVSNPAKPVLISQFNTSGARAVALSSDETKAFVGDSSGLKIIDVRNLAEPVLISNITTLSVWDIALSSDNTKVFVADEGSLNIIDVSNPAEPAIIGQFETKNALSVTLSSDNTKAFVADYYIRGSGLKIINVSNPAKPVLIGQFDIYYARTVTLSLDNTKAFVGDNSGLKIIDVRNPISPAFIGEIAVSQAQAIALSSDETKAFVGDNDGLQIIDIRNLVEPVLIGQIATSWIWDIALSSDETKAFVANRDSGLKIIDIEDFINNQLPPAIKSPTLSFYIDENSPSETFVGQLDINNGSSPVTSITLSGEGAENFKAYNNGTIVVNEGANLDYESENYYYLSVQASNAFGDSNIADIDIYLNNLKDTLPVLQDIYFSIHKRTPSDKTIGVIQIISSDCDITEYVTDGSSVFGIRDNGEVYTTANVTEGSNYTINVYAKSLCGNSNTIKLTIDTKSRIIGQFDTLLHYAYGIALSSDDTKAFVTGGYGGLKIIDVINPFSPSLAGQFNTYAYDVALSSDDTKAFVTDYSSSGRLKIIDIYDPAEPVLIGQINTRDIQYVTLSSNDTKAFVTSGYDGLKIIDISNPAEPTPIGQFNVSSYAEAVTLSSDETKAFVADYTGGLKIIDISNPAEPALINQFDTSYALDIVLSSDNTKAFVADGNSLKIIDVSNPANPVFIGQIATSYARAVVLSSDNTKAFMVDRYDGLKIIDVSNPANPVLISQIPLSNAYDIALSSDNTKAFVVDESGLKIIDIENFINNQLPPVIHDNQQFYIDENSPSETLVGQLNINNGSSPVTSVILTGEGNENFKVYNNGTIVVNDEANLDYESKNSYTLFVKAINEFGSSNVETAYIDVRDMKDTSPVLQNTYINVLHEAIYMDEEIGGIRIVSGTHCEITEFVLDDNSVFGVTEDGLIYVKTAISDGSKYTANAYAVSTCGNSNTIKLTLDTKNRIIGQIDILSYAWTVTLSSDDTKAFVADDEGLKIIDISNPANPVLIGQLDTSSYIYDIVLSSDESKAFVADDDGLKIIDISNPANPTFLGWFDTSSYVEAVALSSDNTKAFVSDYTDGLKIIDVSNPVNPVLIDQFYTSSRATDVILSSDESKIFLINGYYGIDIIDVKNPAKPIFINHIDIYALAAVLSSDDKMFVADGYENLKIIDVSNPENPTLIGQIYTSSYIYDIVLSSDESKAFVVDDYYGLKVIDVTNPANPVFIGQLPMPGYGIALSSDDTKAFVVDDNSGLVIIDVEGF
jgi:hypothetical protein